MKTNQYKIGNAPIRSIYLNTCRAVKNRTNENSLKKKKAIVLITPGFV